MATSAINRSVKIWDLRTLKEMRSYLLPSAANHLAFSQKDILGIAMGNTLEAYQNLSTSENDKPFLLYRTPTIISHIRFCPFEDVLGLGHSRGFSSILVPGSAEPNFDALEVNPYYSKKQRQEMEVKALLDKIQPEFISIEKNILAKVDQPTLLDKIEHAKEIFLKPIPPMEFRANPNKRTRILAHVRARNVRYERQKRYFKTSMELKEKMNIGEPKVRPTGALSRFYSK